MLYIVRQSGLPMSAFNTKALILATLTSLMTLSSYADQNGPLNENSAESIVAHCDNKYPGENQTTQLSVTVKNRLGSEQKAVYKRFWQKTEDEQEQMTLFTITPLDAKNTAFMQYTYPASLGKDTEQWIYLPNLRKLKRITIRDLSDSFLGSDLTHDDIRLRLPEDDTHKLVRVKDGEKVKHFLIESVPKEKESMYSKKVAHYVLEKASGQCLKLNIAYYDKKGSPLKKQKITWQKVKNAWLWERVEVVNAQTFSSSLFEVKAPEVNEGVDDNWFTVRALKKGL